MNTGNSFKENMVEQVEKFGKWTSLVTDMLKNSKELRNDVTALNELDTADVRKFLGINSARNFSNLVLSKDRVIEYCKKNTISTQGQKIIFNSLLGSRR